MKKTLKPKSLFIGFLFKATLYLAFVFATHLTLLVVLEKPLFENLIVLAYLVNWALALIIFSTLLFFRKKANDYLGYIFMYGSFFKFALFFIFFYPSYNKTPGNSKEEFLTFFTPYLVCLIIEIKSLIKLLNSIENKDS